MSGTTPQGTTSEQRLNHVGSFNMGRVWRAGTVKVVRSCGPIPWLDGIALPTAIGEVKWLAE